MGVEATPVNDRPRNLVAGRFTGIPVLLLTAWALVGCYAFVPVTAARPVPVSGNVHVTLSAKGTTAVQSILGTDINAIEGVVVRHTGDTLVVNVERSISDVKGVFESTGVPVALTTDMITDVGVRTISRKRTALLVLGLVAAVLLAFTGANLGSTGDGVLPPPSQP